jgi:hypothetical protein
MIGEAVLSCAKSRRLGPAGARAERPRPHPLAGRQALPGRA